MTFDCYVKIPSKKRNILAIRRYLSKKGLAEFKETRKFETHYFFDNPEKPKVVYFKNEKHKDDFEQWLFQEKENMFPYTVNVKNKDKEWIKKVLFDNNFTTWSRKGTLANCYIHKQFKKVSFKRKDHAVQFKLKI